MASNVQNAHEAAQAAAAHDSNVPSAQAAARATVVRDSSNGLSTVQSAAAPVSSAQPATQAAVMHESKMASNVQNGRPEVPATPATTPPINIDAVRAHLALMMKTA